MTNSYLAWIVRYVPNSTRGEFVNIGVLVGSEYDDWAIRYASNFRRANQLGGEAEKLLPVLRTLKQRIPSYRRQPVPPQLAVQLEDPAPLSVSDIESMRVHKQNVLQISEPRPAFGESAEAVADLLYDHLVLEYIPEPVPQALTRLKNEYEQALESRIPADLDWTRQVQVAFDYRVETFDFAIHRSSSVEQITQAFNFANKDYRRMRDAVDALTLRFNTIRRVGASVSLGTKGPTLPFGADRPLYIVHNEPSGSAQHEIYKNAQRAWSDLGVIRVTEGELMENPRKALAA